MNASLSAPVVVLVSLLLAACGGSSSADGAKADDVVAHGPGGGTEEEKAFLQVDVTQITGDPVGGFDITLGADTMFSSSEESYQLDAVYGDSGFSITVEDRSFVIEGRARAYDGSDAGPGVLRADC